MAMPVRTTEDLGGLNGPPPDLPNGTLPGLVKHVVAPKLRSVFC